MIRTRLAVLALGVLTAVPAFAQSSVTGDWDVTINSPQGSNTTRVTFTQDADNKVNGLFKSPAGELPFTGAMEGSDLKFTFTIQFQGMPLEIAMTGKVEGDAIAGKANFGGFAEGDWTAKRVDSTTAASAPAAATPAAAPTSPASGSNGTSIAGVAGKWDVMLKTPGGDFPATATLTEDAGQVSGTFGSQMGEVAVSGTREGNALKMTMTAQTPQGAMTVVLTGDVDGDSITNGKAEVSGMGQMEWTAKRKP
jgi:hypothetical protein